MIPEQPTVTLMAQGLQAVIVDLKDKVGMERPQRSSPPVSSQTWGLVLKRGDCECKAYAPGETSGGERAA